MSPARMRRMVDFPHPDGPRSATTSNGLIATLMSSSTRSFEPFGITKSCEMPRASHSTSVASAVIVVIGHLVSPQRHRGHRSFFCVLRVSVVNHHLLIDNLSSVMRYRRLHTVRLQ